MVNSAFDIKEMTEGYLECMLFSAPDYSRLGMVETSGEFPYSQYAHRYPKATRQQAFDLCLRFYNENQHLLSTYPARAAGHDLAYTRNRHGVGFWEADHCTKEEGDALAEAAYKLGEQSVYSDRGWFKFE